MKDHQILLHFTQDEIAPNVPKCFLFFFPHADLHYHQCLNIEIAGRLLELMLNGSVSILKVTFHPLILVYLEPCCVLSDSKGIKWILDNKESVFIVR